MFVTHYERLESLSPKHTTSVEKIPISQPTPKHDVCKDVRHSHYSNSVVVITSALHEEGREYSPRSEYVLGRRIERSTLLALADGTIYFVSLFAIR